MNSQKGAADLRMHLGEGWLAIRSSLACPGERKLERETGFEPATSTLARSHSTTELFPPASDTRVYTKTRRGGKGRRVSACAPGTPYFFIGMAMDMPLAAAVSWW